MAGDLTDDLQAAAARMGLPPLEFRTELAQRIQAGDAEDLVKGYMALIERCEPRRYNIRSALGTKTYHISGLFQALMTAFGHRDDQYSMCASLAQGEAEHLLHRLDGDVLLPTQMVDPTVEFLAWLVHVADLEIDPDTVRLTAYERGSSDKWNSTVRAARLDTARALGPSGAAAIRLWCIEVLDAAFAAGWTRRDGHRALPLDPPPGADVPWISLKCIYLVNRAGVTKLATKLRRAGVTVPDPPQIQAAA